MAQTARYAPRTDGEALIAELTRLRTRLAIVSGNGQENFGALSAMISTFDTALTPQIPRAVRALHPDVTWGDVAGSDGVWTAATESLPRLLDALLDPLV